MTSSEILFWKRVSADLGIEVVTPFELTLPSRVTLEFSALVKGFGAKNGMLMYTSFAVIRPHTKTLRELGYGFSGVGGSQYQREIMIEVLTDWGWSGAADLKPSWLP